MNFDNMEKETRKVLAEIESDTAVATALLTSEDTVHIAYCETFQNCILCKGYTGMDTINAVKNSSILKMITLYKRNEQTDREVPCFWLRNYLYDTNHDNINAEVMLMSGEICSLKVFFRK